MIGIRSFGGRPDLVATMTAAAVEGFHQAGEAAVAKHFPGHGDTNVDSHTGLPVIHHNLSQWRAIDAPPFQAAIRAGVDEIMIGHIEVPALDDSGRPASLSRTIVTGLLRDQLGYQGVVVTDSQQMAGVLQGHTAAQVAVQAIQAGCDQLLMPGDPGVAYHAVLRAVQHGQISMSQRAGGGGPARGGAGHGAALRPGPVPRAPGGGRELLRQRGVAERGRRGADPGGCPRRGRLPVAIPAATGGTAFRYGGELSY